MAQVADRFVGSPVLRKEDPELVTGQARFIDDMTLPGMVWITVVRSPYAHARINGIDTAAAKAMPGVVDVLTAADLESDFAGSLPFVWPITEDIKIPVHWPLTKDKARFAGDGVGVVVAETREQAKDAAEAVAVDYESLPVVLDLEEAMGDGACTGATAGRATSRSSTQRRSS
jgi:carbon-monoxide dehydrogenase large subunit